MRTPRDFTQPSPTDQPPIYVRTLGAFEVVAHGIQAAWEGRNAGTKQLQRAFGYLILRRDRPVRRETLMKVAGGHGEGDRRYVIADLLWKLKGWGLDVALKLHRPNITLLRHPIWGTDTDRLEALFDAAQAIRDAGQHERAIQLLEAAELLCLGDYLPIFAPRFDPSLDGAKAHWKNVQKQTLVLLTRLCIAMPSEKRHMQALTTATAAIEFDRDNPDSYRLAAEAARICGNEEIAHYYASLAIERERRQRNGT